jgi:hypothetical protein
MEREGRREGGREGGGGWEREGGREGGREQASERERRNLQCEMCMYRERDKLRQRELAGGESGREHKKACRRAGAEGTR